MQTQAEPADLVVSDKVSFVQPLQSSNKPSAGQTSGSITTSTDQANAYSIQLLRLKANDQQTLQHKIKKWLPVNLHSQVFAHASGPDAFQLFLGPFASGKEAAEQLRQLPEGLQKNQPFIVKQATINKQYNDLAIILKN
jgi:septal ring-binding cell division protein DamX